MTIDERLDLAEKRISALECQLQNGKKTADEITSSWESVLLEFADTFGLGANELRERILKGREEQI